MLKQKFFWLLVVLLLVFWGGYRLNTQRDLVAPREGQQESVSEQREADDLAERGGESVGAELKLEYLGHTAFLLQVGETRCLMDP